MPGSRKKPRGGQPTTPEMADESQAAARLGGSIATPLPQGPARAARAAQARQVPAPEGLAPRRAAHAAGHGRVRGRRAQKSAAHREAILAAALDEFCTRGFAAARLDDVARRAGVAKGTIYLHFRDKQALFEEIVTAMMNPVVTALQKAPPTGVPIRAALEEILELFVREIYATNRRNVLRLVISEGPQFPALAAFYYHHVVERALAALRSLMERALASGEMVHDAPLRFPQLVVAPAITAIIWAGLFDRFAPLDVRALMRAHLDLLFPRERQA